MAAVTRQSIPLRLLCRFRAGCALPRSLRGQGSEPCGPSPCSPAGAYSQRYRRLRGTCVRWPIQQAQHSRRLQQMPRSMIAPSTKGVVVRALRSCLWRPGGWMTPPAGRTQARAQGYLPRSRFQNRASRIRCCLDAGASCGRPKRPRRPRRHSRGIQVRIPAASCRAPTSRRSAAEALWKLASRRSQLVLNEPLQSKCGVRRLLRQSRHMSCCLWVCKARNRGARLDVHCNDMDRLSAALACLGGQRSLRKLLIGTMRRVLHIAGACDIGPDAEKRGMIRTSEAKAPSAEMEMGAPKATRPSSEGLCVSLAVPRVLNELSW